MNRHATTLAIAATATLTAAATLVSLQLSTAASATTSSTQHFEMYSANSNDHDLTDVFAARGPIHGIGVAKPNDDVSGNTIAVVVSMRNGGKVYLKARGPFTWHPNLRTCTATEHDTGTFKITGGTGPYRNARGSGTYIERGAGIGKRDAKGNCMQSFAINYVVVTATGNVQL